MSASLEEQIAIEDDLRNREIDYLEEMISELKQIISETPDEDHLVLHSLEARLKAQEDELEELLRPKKYTVEVRCWQYSGVIWEAITTGKKKKLIVWGALRFKKSPGGEGVIAERQGVTTHLKERRYLWGYLIKSYNQLVKKGNRCTGAH